MNLLNLRLGLNEEAQYQPILLISQSKKKKKKEQQLKRQKKPKSF
jgi:hypothetical protein